MAQWRRAFVMRCVSVCYIAKNYDIENQLVTLLKNVSSLIMSALVVAQGVLFRGYILQSRDSKAAIYADFAKRRWQKWAFRGREVRGRG